MLAVTRNSGGPSDDYNRHPFRRDSALSSGSVGLDERTAKRRAFGYSSRVA